MGGTPWASSGDAAYGLHRSWGALAPRLLSGKDAGTSHEVLASGGALVCTVGSRPLLFHVSGWYPRWLVDMSGLLICAACGVQGLGLVASAAGW